MKNINRDEEGKFTGEKKGWEKYPRLYKFAVWTTALYFSLPLLTLIAYLYLPGLTISYDFPKLFANEVVYENKIEAQRDRLSDVALRMREAREAYYQAHDEFTALEKEIEALKDEQLKAQLGLK